MGEEGIELASDCSCEEGVLAAKVGRANGRDISANVGVEDSRCGTRRQLVGGTI
jgi:hypothetical protein